jgi:membrane glycosyltransferase
MHGVYGFFLRTFGTRRRITALKNYRDQNIDGTSTAIVFPIYNEDVVRVYEGCAPLMNRSPNRPA